jgi:hypothetical protein
MNEQNPSELRVPTMALSADLICADGRSFAGRIFMPVTASRHTGPMRAEEWINERTPFFPFLPDGASTPVVMNKDEIVVLSVPAAADPHLPDDPASPLRLVTIECGQRRLEGTVALEMPADHLRVLDILNGSDSFVTLQQGGRHVFVQKKRITRVFETREG